MRRKEEILSAKNGEKMLRKIIVYIFIYLLAVIIGGLTAGLLSVPFVSETQVSVLRYSFFLGVVTLIYSILIMPVILIFHMLVCRFLPQLYLLNLYPVFAYAIFGVNHFLAGFTFFSSNYWPIRIGNVNIDHLIVLAMAAALSGSTAIYGNIGVEKIKQYYQENNA
ncbi:MAG: hypothetical protein JRJ39_06890 [Deltaproteobacteria bacterium]|nr:hypothetical protein [Deltaproteobacteria bacterium]MBW1846283.1 hypothetical protein [Deltaproteobacteria bacterium]MBW1983705.1 hypothetical protein [Deltaproteobacteria bacterium]MBW2365116.1 hypothetical protein [Deltaproteobacteria bacterium]